MHLKREITVGNILTAISVLIALGGLLYSQWRDRVQATEIEIARSRTAAGAALAVLDRAHVAGELFFERIKPAFVAHSKALAEHRDVSLARDDLWQDVTLIWVETEREIVFDSISGINELAIARPDLLTATRTALEKHKALRFEVYSGLQTALQAQVHSIGADMTNYQSAQLGNALRSANHAAKSDYIRRSLEDLTEIRDPLSSELRNPVMRN